MSNFLNKEQIVALLLKILPFIGGALITRGLMSQDQLDLILNNLPIVAGAIVTVGSFIYSLWKNRPAKQIADVAKKDGVTVGVADQATLDKVTAVDPKAASSVVVAP